MDKSMVKILVIDDEQATCELIEDFFRRKGYDVFSVSNPQASFAVIEKEEPQIIILDLIMPNISGIELLKRIRENYDSNIKVIVVSVIRDDPVIDKVIAMGADSYIEKPFTTDYLEAVVISKIEQLLGHAVE
ncbi:MAG: response regulator [Candidatus Omnitrophota bacterium]